MRFSVQDFPRYTSCLKEFAITARPSYFHLSQIIFHLLNCCGRVGEGAVTSQVVWNTDTPWWP